MSATNTTAETDETDRTDEQQRIEERVKRVIHYNPGGIKRSSILITLCAHAGEDPDAVNAALDRLKERQEVGCKTR